MVRERRCWEYVWTKMFCVRYGKTQHLPRRCCLLSSSCWRQPDSHRDWCAQMTMTSWRHHRLPPSWGWRCRRCTCRYTAAHSETSSCWMASIVLATRGCHGRWSVCCLVTPWLGDDTICSCLVSWSLLENPCADLDLKCIEKPKHMNLEDRARCTRRSRIDCSSTEIWKKGLSAIWHFLLTRFLTQKFIFLCFIKSKFFCMN